MNDPTIGELLAAFRKAQDYKDECDEALKSARQACDVLELKIKIAMEHAGTEKTSAHGVTASIVTKWRAKYAPDKWSDLVKWAAGNGYDYLIQRRLTDSKVMELVDQGVELPDGLSVESYKDINFRRA
jgi:hypothetical protein